MNPVCRHLQFLFSAELLDLVEDLHALEDIYKTRYQRSEITNYVYLENESVLQQEIDGLHEIRKRLASNPIEAEQNLAEAVHALKILTTSIIREDGYPEGLIPLLERKLDKLASYCEADEANR